MLVIAPVTDTDTLAEVVLRKARVQCVSYPLNLNFILNSCDLLSVGPVIRSDTQVVHARGGTLPSERKLASCCWPKGTAKPAANCLRSDASIHIHQDNVVAIRPRVYIGLSERIAAS